MSVGPLSRRSANFSLVPKLKLISGGLRAISDEVGQRRSGEAAERLPDADAFDAYSRTVAGVAERLAPSVAHLARRERAPAAGALPRAPAAASRSPPTATC